MATPLENYLSGTQDPSVTATVGLKGQIFVRTGASGGSAYIKTDDGSTINWTAITGSFITALTSDVTATGPGSVAATIAANAVTNAKAAQMAANTFKGNNTGSTANASDLTATQLTAALNNFTTSLKGLAPSSGGGTLNFLRADATWTTPPGISGNQFLTSGTTFTTAANITSLTKFKFTLVGGGGGGGGISTVNGSGSGGGGGGTNIVFLTGLADSTGYTIVIGAAGAAGATTPTAGGTGGNTTISINATTYTASGGTGGAATVSTNGGAGGTTTNATIGITGKRGGASGSANPSGTSGSGGDSQMGQGGSPSIASAGAAGSGFGAGGSGGNGNPNAGGAGSQGAILAEWWS